MRMNRDERGAYAPAYTAVVTLVTVLLAGILINRVAWTAESINDKAETIKQSAIGIGPDTEAVLNLDATNASASSILVSAEPLDGQLRQIVSLAQGVNVTPKSINDSATTVSGTARDINGTAGGITGSAGGINDRVAAILSQAQSIKRGVDQINTNLDTTIAVVNRIREDTGGIRGQANTADRGAACIDGKLPVGASPGSNEPDC